MKIRKKYTRRIKNQKYVDFVVQRKIYIFIPVSLIQMGHWCIIVAKNAVELEQKKNIIKTQKSGFNTLQNIKKQKKVLKR